MEWESIARVSCSTGTKTLIGLISWTGQSHCRFMGATTHAIGGHNGSCHSRFALFYLAAFIHPSWKIMIRHPVSSASNARQNASHACTVTQKSSLLSIPPTWYHNSRLPIILSIFKRTARKLCARLWRTARSRRSREPWCPWPRSPCLMGP